MRSWASCGLTGVNQTLWVGKQVGYDQLYFGVPLSEDVTDGRAVAGAAGLVVS
jgi:hypothetical protein